MNEQERREIESQMRSKLERIESHIADLEEATRPIPPENAIGRLTRMDAINNRSVNEAALRQARIRRDAIVAALERIDDPDFGRCDKCGKSIPAGRLLLVPESPRCVNCAR